MRWELLNTIVQLSLALNKQIMEKKKKTIDPRRSLILLSSAFVLSHTHPHLIFLFLYMQLLSRSVSLGLEREVEGLGHLVIPEQLLCFLIDKDFRSTLVADDGKCLKGRCASFQDHLVFSRSFHQPSTLSCSCSSSWQ